MENIEKIKKLCQVFDPIKVVTIRDLEEKEYSGQALNAEEQEALEKFRGYKLKKLNKKISKEDEFHSRYEYFRALSNLMDYRQFNQFKAI